MEILGRLSKNRLDTKMFRVQLFSFFTIKTLLALAALRYLNILKKLTNILLTICGSSMLIMNLAGK